MDGMSPRQGGAPVRADGRRSHQELLTAARETFAVHGTEASLREVARRAGVSIATLYRHFPTRETLLEALLGDGFDALTSRAAELSAATDPGQALAQWIRELALAVARYDGLPSAVATAMHDPDSTLHASCVRFSAAASQLLAHAQRAGHIRDDLRTDELLTMVSAVAWAAGRAAGQAAPTGEDANRYVDLLVEGMATRPA
jgi:AcrR family transcriptional regulator